MANNFKKGIDRQMWVTTPPALNTHAVGGCLFSDLRNDISRNPFVYHLGSSTALNRFNIITKSWSLVLNPSLGGTFGAGSAGVFAPSRSLSGTIAAGATTTKFQTSSVITGVGVNMLANRGGSGEYGFKIRVIGLAAGKVEERFIIGNSGGTTPTFLLDEPLSFTPSLNDQWEILGGRVYLLNSGSVASGIFKSFEVATNTTNSALATTNLPATIGTDSVFVALDEQYVPYDCKPGEGFILGTYSYNGTNSMKALTSTGAAAGTLTGHATDGDSGVVANEYRNFQIRIVEDLTNPTAVGQRRIIASHTAGASPVYTLGSNWTVTPSSGCKYVIEYPNLLLLKTSAVATTYTYNYNAETINNGTNTIGFGAWSTTYFANSGTLAAGAIFTPSFGIRPDSEKNSRHSYLYFFRGGGVSTLDLFDISGSATGTYTANLTYDGGVTISNGSCGAYSPSDQEGRFVYINSYVANAYNQMFRFDTKNRVLSPYTPTDWLQNLSALTGGRMAAYTCIDGTDKYGMVMMLLLGQAVTNELLVQV